MPEADSRFTHKDKINCLIREIGFRQRMYPKWAAENKMSYEDAEHEIACMKEILNEIKVTELVDFCNRTKLVVEVAALGYIVTGAFNGFSMRETVMSEDDFRSLLVDHGASNPLVDFLMKKE